VGYADTVGDWRQLPYFVIWTQDSHYSGYFWGNRLTNRYNNEINEGRSINNNNEINEGNQ